MPRKTPTGPTHRQQRQKIEEALILTPEYHYHRAARKFHPVMPPMGQGDEAVPTSDHEEPRYPNYSHAESMFGARKLG